MYSLDFDMTNPPKNPEETVSGSLSSTWEPLFNIVSTFCNSLIPNSRFEFCSDNPTFQFPHYVPPETRKHLLCMPFLYLFTFRSNTEYLSFGNISCSVGISTFHLSTFFIVCPCLASAVLSVVTKESTFRKRSRCRYFWWRERRHGIFLR